MQVESIYLKGFRNISDLRLDFSPGMNVLIGQNAQGKTNIIEAIGLLATGTSFRTPEFRDMIGWNAVKASVSATVSGEMGKDLLQISIDERKKGFLRNGKRAMPKGPSRVRAILFAPEEIMLLRSSPGARRRYIDSFISQMSGSHRGHVSKYEKVMRQRNRILSDFDTQPAKRVEELAPWDEQLIDFGARIVVEREGWLARLNEGIPSHYGEIAPADGSASFHYAPHCGRELLEGGVEMVRDGLSRQLELRRGDELTRGVTLVGPHRDDLEARIGAAVVKSFGSQGQHRSFVLALKLAEMGLIRELTGEEPILLLDDVASELDSQRNRLFFEGIRAGRGQVFITATQECDVRVAGDGAVRLFHVEAGRATPRK